MSREVMQQALEALWTTATPKGEEAIKAIKAALAQPEQEPVAWWDAKIGVFNEKHFDQLQPLYTSPPQRQPLPGKRVDAFYQALSKDDRSKQFTVQNWFQAGFATSEAAHGIGENTLPE